MATLSIYIRERFITSGFEIFRKILFAAITLITCMMAVRTDVFETYDKAKVAYFLFNTALLVIGIFNSIYTYNNEKEYVDHHCQAGLTPSAYYFGNLVFQICLCTLQTVGALIILNVILTPPDRGELLAGSLIEYGVSIFIMLMASDIIGLGIAVISPGEKVALTILPMIIISQLTLSGTLFTFKEDGVMDKIQEYFIFRHGMGALGTIVDLNNPDLPTKMQLIYPGIQKPLQGIYEFSAENLYSHWLFMGCISVALLMVGYVILYFRIYRKRK